MQIKMLRTTPGSPNGMVVRTFNKFVVYGEQEVSRSLMDIFVKEGFAVWVGGHAELKKENTEKAETGSSENKDAKGPSENKESTGKKDEEDTGSLLDKVKDAVIGKKKGIKKEMRNN